MFKRKGKDMFFRTPRGFSVLLSTIKGKVCVTFDRHGWYATHENCFPAAGSADGPSYVVCNDCEGPGWGPMLIKKLWEDVTNEEERHCRFFLCEDCIEKRLNRKLQPGDLRDCPMNVFHRCYRNDGAY